MAKAKKRVARKTAVETIAGQQGREVLQRLRKVDPNLLVELTLSKGPSLAGHFSDWHDRFKDGDRFTDGFGKAGG